MEWRDFYYKYSNDRFKDEYSEGTSLKTKVSAKENRNYVQKKVKK